MNARDIPGPVVSTISYRISFCSDNCPGSKLILKSSYYPWGNWKTERLVTSPKAHSYCGIDSGFEPRQFCSRVLAFDCCPYVLYSLFECFYTACLIYLMIWCPGAYLIFLIHKSCSCNSEHYVICVINLNDTKEIHKDVLVKGDVII